MNVEQICAEIAARPAKGKKRLVGLVGAPASGKTTLAHALAKADPSISVVPMDGFHLDNGLLEKRGLRHRKGAPETFDAAGFAHLLKRLVSGEPAFYPLFDRALDKSIAGAGELDDRCQTILVEGNYLLLKDPAWIGLSGLWDFTISVNVPMEELRQRLLSRWREFGFSESEAKLKADGNDIPNAELVVSQSYPANLVLDRIAL